MSKIKFEDCFNAEKKKLTEAVASKLKAAGYCVMSSGQSAVTVKYAGRLTMVPYNKVEEFMATYKL